MKNVGLFDLKCSWHSFPTIRMPYFELANSMTLVLSNGFKLVDIVLLKDQSSTDGHCLRYMHGEI